MARLSVILFLILTSIASIADTLDYNMMSRIPAKELFEKATAYSKCHREDTAAAYYLYTIGACSRESGDDAMLMSAKAYRELGKCYYNQGYYSKALEAFTNALKICDANGFTDQLPHLYNNIGSIYCTWNDLDTGLHYFRRGLAALGHRTNEDVYIKLLINIIGAECRLGNVEAAWKAYKPLSAHANRNPETGYYCLLNRGLILIAGNKPSDAKPHIAEAARFAEQKHLSPVMTGYTYSTLGDLLLPDNPDSAILCYNKALSLDVTPFMRRTLLKNMADIYRATSPRMADTYERQYLQLTDSLFDDNEINRTKGAQFLYETEKNYRRMEQLAAEKAEQAASIRSQRITIAVASVIIVIFLILIIMVIRRTIKLRDAYRNLFSHSKEVIEEERRSRERREALEGEIISLRAQLKIAENDTPVSGDSPRQQSYDRLTDTQKFEIETAIQSVVDRRREIFDCDFTIETLADLTGYNSKYISKIIKETTGNNFRAWINALRIREAQVRLLDTGNYGTYTISAIAQSVGYRSHGNFILLFKKATGLSPSAYQKMARADSCSSDDGGKPEE